MLKIDLFPSFRLYHQGHHRPMMAPPIPPTKRSLGPLVAIEFVHLHNLIRR